MYQISPAGSHSYTDRLEHYIEVAQAAVAEGDVLRGIVPPENVPYFQQFVTRLAQQYTQADCAAPRVDPRG